MSAGHETPATEPSGTRRGQTVPTPLGERDALTLSEAAALGYGSERTLRTMIAAGRLRRCVLRVGVRGVRLLRVQLVEELQARS